MRWSLICLAAFYGLTAFAQKSSQPKQSKFFSANSMALLRGEAGTAFGIQTVNGWQWGIGGAGIGIGYDNYKRRSVPVFAQLKLHIPHTNFFVYGAAGRNFTYKKSKAEWLNGNKAEEDGRYLEAGLQYNWQLPENKALIFSIGYTEKTYNETQATVNPCLIGPCPEEKNTWHYTFRRMALRAGWQF